jgi:DNA-binding response OmpR family regulator
VLLVEDDDILRPFISDVLTDAGFSVTAVRLAGSVFEVLRGMTPGVIVLDLGMPVGTLQGMELLAQLRETDTWRAVPVVILSGLGDVVNRDVTARLGVSAVMSKPLIVPDDLVDAIRRASA